MVGRRTPRMLLAARSSELLRELTRPRPYLNKIRSIVRTQPELLGISTQPNLAFAIPIVIVCTTIDHEMESLEDKTQLIKFLAEEGIKHSICGPNGRGGLLMNLNSDDKTQDPITCFHMLVGKNDASALASLARVDKGTPLLTPDDIVNYNLLHLASSCGFIKVVECLLNICPHSLIQKNGDGNYPIHISAMKGHKDIFTLLMQRGIEQNFGGREGLGGLFVRRSCRENCAQLTALDCWIIQSFQEWTKFAPSIKHLLQDFPLIQTTIRTAHFLAMRRAIKSLIESFDCARTRDGRGKLPLHVAAAHGLKWGDGFKEILESNPHAVEERDNMTNLPPFALAAAASEHTKDLTCIFVLLRQNPEPVIDVCRTYKSTSRRRRIFQPESRVSRCKRRRLV